MHEKTRVLDKCIFGLEVAFALLIPFVIWWSTTPTNILNSSLMFKLLEAVGIGGSDLIMLTGIPVGIIGIIKAKGMKKLRKATVVLSIINLSAASIEIIILAAIFCAVIFGRASV